MQKGLLLKAGDHTVSKIDVPAPSDEDHIRPTAYSQLLKGADPQHLLLAAVPLSELAGRRVLLVYDASGSSGQLNAAATRLTTTLEEGLEVQVFGDAVALYSRPGSALTQADWQQLDNAIYDELAGCFSQGQAPTQKELQQLVDDFKAGRYDYSRGREGEEGEDVNKDDAGEDFQDALRDA